MKIIALGSVRGAPGVTTATMLLAALIEEDVVVVEGDLSGGVLATRYELGREPGLTTFAAAGRAGPHQWRNHAQNAGGVAVIVGPDSPDSAHALWRRAGDQIAGTLANLDTPVIVDMGRLGVTAPILDHAALLLLLVRPVAEDLVTLSHRVRSLSQQYPALRVGAVVVGDGPYRSRELDHDLDVDVLGSFPDDRRAAAILQDGGSARALARSRLARSVQSLVPVATILAGYYFDEPAAVPS